MRVRLAELLAVLALGADLGMDQPMEHVLRECLLAVRLAERMGLPDSEREVVYYASLVAWVGCHVDAYEQAKWFGDDLALKGDFRTVDFTTQRVEMAFMMRHLGSGRPFLQRLRTGAGFMGEGRHAAEQMLLNHCYASDDLAAGLGLNAEVRQCVEQTFERWDGRGAPKGAKGDEIALASRLITLADVVEVYHRIGGLDAAVSVANARSGTQFDPGVVDAFVSSAHELFDGLDGINGWNEVIASEPALDRVLTEDELDKAFTAVAVFVDVKSPFTLGHSGAVAELASEAATASGLGANDARLVRWAGLLHDLGRLGVSNAVWDKTSPLSQAELERVRLHPYLTERMLASSPCLAMLGALAVQHHERLDGSGYPRGISGDALSPAGRVLGAADMYRSKVEPRPHRAAGTPEQAAAALRDEVRAGRLDPDAVDSVLKVAGHRVPKRREWPSGLTSREVEVLQLLARGLTNKEIAAQLVISRRTVNNHIEHVYTKLGVNNRALASLFAAKHGLMDRTV